LVGSRFARSAAGVAGAVLCLVATTAAPAAAVTQEPVTVTLDCIVPGTDGTYRAVFGYDSPTTKYTIPIGVNNRITPQSLDRIQPNKFEVGSYRGAFTTPPVDNGQQVTWTVTTSASYPTSSATASSSSTACAPPVSLPAEGNGTGPVLIVAASVLVTFMILSVRRRVVAHPAD